MSKSIKVYNKKIDFIIHISLLLENLNDIQIRKVNFLKLIDNASMQQTGNDNL